MLFYEDGEPIIDGESGDLRVSNLSLSISMLLCMHCADYYMAEQFRIRTAPHDVFRREGNDLHTTVTITLVSIALVDLHINCLSCTVPLLFWTC